MKNRLLIGAIVGLGMAATLLLRQLNDLHATPQAHCTKGAKLCFHQAPAGRACAPGQKCTN